MQTIQLTDNGPDVSALGLGCNNFGHNLFGNHVPYEDCEPVVHAALDAGYTFFDTAEAYSDGESEEILGRALGSARADVLVATKFGAGKGMPGGPDARCGSAAYIRWAIEQSLRRLGTDYIDLYQMHMPDPETPIAETLGVLGELVTEGKVRFVGVGGFSSEQLDDAAAASRAGDLPYPVSSMTYYSLLTRRYERDVIPTCERLGIRVHPWFVLESGLLTGKFSRTTRSAEGSRANPMAGGVRDEVWDVVEQLERFASARGVSIVDVAIGGIAAMPGVGVVIAGASSPEQVRANVAARDWTPTPADLEELRALPWATPSEWLE